MSANLKVNVNGILQKLGVECESGKGKGQMSEQQIQDIQKAFEVFDQNQDGKLSRDEIEVVLKRTGCKFTEEQLNAFMTKIDTDKNGSIDFQEFCCMMKDVVQEAGDMEEKTRQAFRCFDKDGSGKITKEELRKAMSELGEELSDQELDSLIKTVDRDGDGHINYPEFVTMIYIFQVGAWQ